jgi:hypothetical protein
MPFCAGDISADEKGISCFEPGITAGENIPARCTGKKHVYILSLRRFSKPYKPEHGGLIYNERTKTRKRKNGKTSCF